MEKIYSQIERFIIFLLIIIPLLFIGLFFSGLPYKAPVRADAVGYFSYLPATFNFKDLSFNFMIKKDALPSEGINSFERVVNPSEARGMGYVEMDGGKYLNKYPIGVAILLIPFFILGHLLSIIFGTETNGWSFFYQYSVFYGGITYFLAGIFFLKKSLERYFSKKATVVALIGITLGTNLLNYASFENVFSHVYSFFLFSLFIFLFPLWLEKKNLWMSVLIGLNIGFLCLIRQMNVILVIPMYLFFDTWNLDQIKERIRELWKRRLEVMISFFVSVIVFLPQCLYWKYATGKFLVFSYVGEGFNFLSPQIINLLFSSQKGLFFWSPILIFSVAGFWFMKGWARKYILPFLVILLLQTYFLASWHSWQLGWSFGSRGFVDTMAIFAFGLAAFYEKLLLKKRWNLIVLFASILLIFVSLFQMVQYWLHILPPVDTSLEQYSHVFLKMDRKLVYFWRSE